MQETSPAIEGTITKKPNNNNNSKNGIARVLGGKHGGGAVSSDGAVHSTLLPKENGATVRVNCDQDQVRHGKLCCQVWNRRLRGFVS